MRGYWLRDRPGYAYSAPAWHRQPNGWAYQPARWERSPVPAYGTGPRYRDRDRDGIPDRFDRHPGRYDRHPHPGRPGPHGGPPGPGRHGHHPHRP